MNTSSFMDTRCFACGKDNDKGLRLDITQSSDNAVQSFFRVPAWCQGYQDIVHGGIVSTILDELGVWAAYYAGCKCVTAELTVRIKNSMRADTPYVGKGIVLKHRHAFIQAYAEILDEQSILYAYAHLKLMKMT